MDDFLNNDPWYSGVEPVDVGDLTDVKETRTVIPATKDVKMVVLKAENHPNKDNTYRQINLTLKLTEGIGVDNKYRNMWVPARVCYYADLTIYTKDFFKTRQYLVQLKYLLKACGIEETRIDGHTLEKILQTPILKADIIVKKRIIKTDDGTGNQIEETILENEAKNFKALTPEELA